MQPGPKPRARLAIPELASNHRPLPCQGGVRGRKEQWQ